MDIVGLIKGLNWIDLLIVIIVVRISYIAFQDGLSHEIFPIFGSVIMAVLGLHYYNKIALFFSENLVKAPIEILNFLTFLVIITAAGFLFKLVRILLDKIVKVEWHPLIEKFGGLIAGICRGAIASSLILIILGLVPLKYFQYSIRDRSLMGMTFLRIAPRIYEKASGFIPTLKMEGAPVDREEIVKKLASDKSLESKSKKEKKPTRWEKWDEEVGK